MCRRTTSLRLLVRTYGHAPATHPAFLLLVLPCPHTHLRPGDPRVAGHTDGDPLRGPTRRQGGAAHPRVLHVQPLQQAAGEATATGGCSYRVGPNQALTVLGGGSLPGLVCSSPSCPICSRFTPVSIHTCLICHSQHLSQFTLALSDLQHEMPSWCVLTPFYEEDVIYALDAPALAESMGLPTAGGRSCYAEFQPVSPTTCEDMTRHLC